MALRNLRTIGDDILHKKSKPVENFDSKLHQLLDDMLETMYDADGVGIAAVQVGVLRRALVMDFSEESDDPIEMINPEIIHIEGEQEGREGCLSVPGKTGSVVRPLVTVVKAQDRHGKTFETTLEDRATVIFSHEFDHLNGVLYIDKATDIRDNDDDD